MCIKFLQDIKLPEKIDPCPILEAIVEFRFDSDFPDDAIFGIVYNEFKEDYSKVTELPILQIPEAVRKQDPLLKYKPYYKLSKDDKFLFQVGARVISLISLNGYAGWSSFSERLKNLLNRVKKIKIANYFSRVALRYINGFDGNIFENIDLSLKIKRESITNCNTSLNIEIPTGLFNSKLQISNNAEIIRDQGIIKGSVIDIDTFIENPSKDPFELLETGHTEEKRLFFSLLKQDFVKEQLNPEY